ncbi:hypothetical protein [Parasitella parasitica]|uniref:Uncharacterized protein n=1 Tax=Parasitella parasitica TaxID=35722 RepID=A0A0B7NF28_9FUNG|nr:hypothetical protein [Parasitella parasitica]
MVVGKLTTHYIVILSLPPSFSDFICDQLDTEEPEYQPKEVEGTIKTSYRLENLSDISISSEEEEESLDPVVAIEDFKLGLARLPAMVWTPAKYEPSHMAEFISLIQNHNFETSKAAVKAQIEPKSAYK